MSETIQSLQDEKVKLDEQKEVMDVLMTMFSENGIKTYIAAKYIPIINNIISEILDYMELNYRVKFDEKFDGGITLNGYNVNYSTLSAGEKKRIDFACVISIIKFLKLQIGELNLLFLDELFANLDINGVSDMIDLLKKLSQEINLNIYLIHHAQLEGIVFDKIIQTSKPDGFSKITIVE